MKRVGMLGTGNIAHIHAAAWKNLPVELVGFYDVRSTAAEQFGQQYGGQVFTSVNEFLDNVDIVDICTPSHVHRENVLAAAQAGKAIVCEKPLARHLADGYAMIEACEAAGVLFFVAQVVRFFPQFAKAKSVIESGAIGKPGVIRTIRAGTFPQGRPFFADFELSGGVILDVGIHDIDFHRWCMGEVERVFARGLTFSDVTGRDHALITLRFVEGGVGHIEAGWVAPPGVWRTRLEICGDDGMLEWDSDDPDPITQVMYNAERSGKIAGKASPLSPADNPYQQELAHFLDCLESGRPLRVTPHDALMAVKVALAAIESVRTGKVIEMDKFDE